MLQGIVVRGSTPSHEFDIIYDSEYIQDVWITYGQNNKEIFTKTRKDCVFQNNIVRIQLTQEETYMFSSRYRLDIQIKIKLFDKVLISEEPISLRVIDSLNKEVMN